MIVTIFGAGYVGLSIGVSLATKHRVLMVEVNEERIEKINNRECYLKDPTLEKYMSEFDGLNIRAMRSCDYAYNNVDYFIIATPTNFDEQTKKFDTSSIDTVLTEIHKYRTDNPIVIIKSTIPIGYTKQKIQEFSNDNIIFSPEFLREGSGLDDIMNPSRIIIGHENSEISAKKVADLFFIKNKIHTPEIIYTGSEEAESIKLFANTYLAMRVAFFNELDNFAIARNLKTKDIIKGICLDPRIGMHYNNPSFGYGGYCLPKDSKQLLHHFEYIPNKLIKAIVESNDIRTSNLTFEITNFADSKVKDREPVIGVYRLNAKANSDNCRQSSVTDIIKKLKRTGYNVVIYEPLINESSYCQCNVIEKISEFKNSCDIIVANRIDPELEDVMDKVYTRDIFNTL